MDANGFFKGLMDLDFKNFVALKFIKVIYVLGMVLIGLGAVAFLVASVSRGGANIFFGVIVVPLVALLYLVFFRVYLEVIAVLFRIGENSSRTVELLGGRSAAPGDAPEA